MYCTKIAPLLQHSTACDLIYAMHTMTHHISFLCEDGIVETLQGHPFVGQLHIGSAILSEVSASIDVLSQTKVPHPDTPSRVQPIGMYRWNHTTIIIVFSWSCMYCRVSTYLSSVLLTRGATGYSSRSVCVCVCVCVYSESAHLDAIALCLYYG